MRCILLLCHTAMLGWLIVFCKFAICQFSCYNNESTAGADASVEMPKLHNIKLAY